MAVNTGTAVGYSSTNITSQTTTAIRTGSGILHSIVFNKPTATAVVTVYDNTAASGTVLATITVPASPMPVAIPYDIVYTTGLTVKTATADSDITVTYI